MYPHTIIQATHDGAYVLITQKFISACLLFVTCRADYLESIIAIVCNKEL